MVTFLVGGGEVGGYSTSVGLFVVAPRIVTPLGGNIQGSTQTQVVG